MMDAPLRRMLTRPLSGISGVLDVRWITPDRLTMAGLVIGLASAGLAAVQWWPLAVVAWLLSRLFDGLDGSLARRRRAAKESTPPVPEASGTGVSGHSEAGGFLDIVSDFVAYGATVLGVAIGANAAFSAPWWPFLLVLFSYYLNGTAFLAFSSIAERTGRTTTDADNRSLFFLGRIAEGGETILVHSLWLILPFIAWQIALVWSVFVFASAIQRMIVGYRLLR